MPNCDFYALDDDCLAVLDFVFDQPTWKLFELASLPDQELRSFTSTAEVVAAHRVGERATYFQLHAPEMKGQVVAKRIDFTPGAVAGATHRYSCEGWGLIQLHLGAPSGGRLSSSHTNHNSARRARTWEPTYPDATDRVDDWDFAAVTRLSSRLNRFIRGRAVARQGSRSVLAAAHDAFVHGRLTPGP